jgi:signal transduction histidine kinase
MVRELGEKVLWAGGRAAGTSDAPARRPVPAGPTSPAQPPPTSGWPARLLLWLTVCLGLVVVGRGLVEVTRQSAWPLLLPFLGLALVAEGFTVQVFEANRQRISLSFTIAVTMAAVTVVPAGAPLVSLTAALVHVVSRRQRQLDKALFNLSNPAVAAAVAGAVAAALQPPDPVMTVWHLAAALAAVGGFSLANIGLITLMISLHGGRPLLAVAREASWFAPTNIVLGLTGAFLGVAYDEIGVIGVALFIAPLLVMRLTLALYVRQSQQTIAALEAAHAAAEAAVRTREEFLSVASHELRTPLTTIKGYVQAVGRLVRQPAPDVDQLKRYVAHLQVQVGRLEGLVLDLLDSSRIQQGRLDLRREQLDLAALAREVVERFQEAPERTPAHRLVLEAPAPVVGRWDPARLDQVLTNLLSNAFKYSPRGGTVRVAVVAAGGGAELRVSDEGIGIPAAEQGRLFQPFARGSATPRNIPGAGLGLYITAQIVARHGGRIAVDSQPGRGSAFTVWLPLAPPAE